MSRQCCFIEQYSTKNSKHTRPSIFQMISTNLAKCHLILGNLAEARTVAEKVLDTDIANVTAIYVKAESLYYTCKYEHAMVMYHRGLVSIYIYIYIAHQNFSRKYYVI